MAYNSSQAGGAAQAEGARSSSTWTNKVRHDVAFSLELGRGCRTRWRTLVDVDPESLEIAPDCETEFVTDKAIGDVVFFAPDVMVVRSSKNVLFFRRLRLSGTLHWE